MFALLAYDESGADYEEVALLCAAMQERAVNSITAATSRQSEDWQTGSPARKRIRTAEVARTTGGHTDDAVKRNGSRAPNLYSTSSCALITRSVGMRRNKSDKPVPLVVEVPSSCSSVNGGVVQDSAIMPRSVLLALSSAPEGVGFCKSPRVVSESEAPNALTQVCVVTCQVQEGTEWVLANGNIQARISSSGRLKSLLMYDKHDRETIEAPRKETVAAGYFGEGNSLIVYDDTP